MLREFKIKTYTRCNPESTMGRVQAMVNDRELARKARFYVEFNLPSSLGGGLDGSAGSVSSSMTDETYGSFRTVPI
ncbi:MAG: hypothetical protein CM15mV25_1880 [uncultured marine virus]|nr:MAG: hypothetical protein CM15mV25_1880 [uncultured marine virus]